jgi:hypothetical protein
LNSLLYPVYPMRSKNLDFRFIRLQRVAELNAQKAL